MNTDFRSRTIKQRISIIFLSLIVAVSMMPFYAFAEDVPAEAQAQSEELQSEDTPTAEDAEFEDSQDIDDAAEAEPSDAADPESSDAAEDEEEFSEFELIEIGSDVPDSEEMLEQYIENKSGVDIANPEAAESAEEGQRKAKLYTRRALLSANEQKLYDEIKAGVKRIADGKSDDTHLIFTLGYADFRSCNFNRVLNAILTDLPYEMYWCDKTTGAGVLHGYMGGKSMAYFSVAKNYRSSQAPEKIPYKNSAGEQCYYEYYRTDLSKTQAAAATISSAREIVNKYADLGDLDKLNAYREEICALTDYDHSTTITDDYGDPWQIIYVFDGDPSTNVVCEGYAKAFQFLCDVSTFENNTIESYTVSGHLESVPHMWNVLHMDDGRNYIADITNCDKGTIGDPDYLFLKGYIAGSASEGYIFATKNGLAGYYYDTDAYSLYYGAELTLSDTDYDQVSDDEKVTRYPAKAATCTKSGTREYWVKGSLYYSDKFCSDEITQADTIVKALGHSWYDSYNSLDYKTQKCRRCGITRKVSKVVVDLPKVTIKKPARAKGAFTARWSKVSAKNRKKIAGIEIQYSTTKSFTDKTSVVRTAKKTASSKKITKLKRKKTYYVRVRSYKMIGGKKHVSKWSSVKSIKTK